MATLLRTLVLTPYKRPPKIRAHGRTKDWVTFRKTPVIMRIMHEWNCLDMNYGCAMVSGVEAQPAAPGPTRKWCPLVGAVV